MNNYFDSSQKPVKSLEELRETIRQEKEAARTACALRKERIRNSAGRETEKARKLLQAERALQAELRRVESRSKKTERRTTARERRAESDDAVRAAIDPDLHPLFEKVKRKIRGSDRLSRTEEFLAFVHARLRRGEKPCCARKAGRSDCAHSARRSVGL